MDNGGKRIEILGLADPWVWIQPRTDAELLRRLAEARDFNVHERERENLCSVAHDRIAELASAVKKLPGPEIAS